MNDTPSPVLRLTRAQQRFLSLHGQPAKHPHEDPLTDVVVARSLRPFFESRLEIGGHHLNGPVFGHREGQTLHIHNALPAGYGIHPPFSMDESYLLGASDAFQQNAPNTEWIGQWLIRPDSLIPDQREIEDMFEQARATRLITEEGCLLWSGWQEGKFSFLTVTLTDPTGDLVQLRCNLGDTFE